MKTARDERKVEYRELTAKQLHFARCVAQGMTNSDAYREAYEVRSTTKAETVHRMAHELYRHPKVSAMIKTLIARKQERLEAAVVDDRRMVTEKLRAWTENPVVETKVDAEGNEVPVYVHPAQLKAAELLGKSVGMFRDVVEQHSDKSAGELEQELRELADRLLGDTHIDEARVDTSSTDTGDCDDEEGSSGTMH